MASQKNNLLIINLLMKKKTIGNVSYGLKKFYCRCLSLIKSSWNFLSKMKKTNRAWTYWDRRNIRNFTWTVSFRFFYSLSNSFQNNIPKNRHLSIGDENILKGYLVLITQMVALSLFYLLYHIFPVIKSEQVWVLYCNSKLFDKKWAYYGCF